MSVKLSFDDAKERKNAPGLAPRKGGDHDGDSMVASSARYPEESPLNGDYAKALKGGRDYDGYGDYDGTAQVVTANGNEGSVSAGMWVWKVFSDNWSVIVPTEAQAEKAMRLAQQNGRKCATMRIKKC